MKNKKSIPYIQQKRQIAVDSTNVNSIVGALIHYYKTQSEIWAMLAYAHGCSLWHAGKVFGVTNQALSQRFPKDKLLEEYHKLLVKKNG